MTQPAAWSYSRLTSFETCPRKFWHLSVQKDLKEEESAAMRDGTRVHKAFEDRLRDGKLLPIDLRQFEPLLKQIHDAPSEKIIEQQIALTSSYQITDWFSKNAWLRVKSDLTQMRGKYAICWDWKTGKRKDEFTQLKLNASVVMLLAPEIEEVTMAFVWTKVNQVSKEKLHRSQAADVWGALLKRVAAYQQAHDTNFFPPKQNAFCGGCVVKTCQFYKEKRK